MVTPLTPMEPKQAHTPEWETEPNRTAFEHAGFPCITKRHPTLKHWCGYVGVPPGHPWHGKDDQTIYGTYDEDFNRSEPSWPVPEVHGGVTYGRACDGDPIDGVCHIAAPGEPDDVWWIGFDCAHSGDYSPGIGAGLPHSRFQQRFDHETYRNLAYIQAECRSVAEQARAALSRASGGAQ